MLRLLQTANLEPIRQMFEQWWLKKEIPDSILHALVVSIFKKGNPALLENYRPLSLLDSFYKLYAGILKQRLAQGLEHILPKTQYGFRPHHSAPEPIYIIRRLQDHGSGGGKFTSRDRTHLGNQGGSKETVGGYRCGIFLRSIGAV